MTKQSIHQAVMVKEVLEYLQAEIGGIYLDCTLGGGGHTKAILDANMENICLALDRDPEVTNRTKNYLSSYSNRLKIFNKKFSEAAQVCQGERVNGVLVDLGLSSDQLAEKRGFSFKDQNSLDMRMNLTENTETAVEILNNSSLGELISIFRRGGVGTQSKQFAAAICKSRPINNASDLAAIIEKNSNPSKSKPGRHPATVVFQALRIEVNNEFFEINSLLETAPKIINKGGRLVVISFHSLEDRLVTKAMRTWSQGDTSPANIPQAIRNRSLGKLLTPKAQTPSELEVEKNPRSRSARLRAFEFREYGL